MVCRAVSSSIADHHLNKFLDKIIEVETCILKKDAGYVGAYDIVPLSTIVSEFAPWTRRLEWLSMVAKHLDGSSKGGHAHRQSSAADVLNVLERETRTGYSDVQDMAVALLIVAQRAWMRAASLWILYGKLPTAGSEDFCVKTNPRPSSNIDTFLIEPSLVPKCVSSTAASALLSTGSALNQLRSQRLTLDVSVKGSHDPSLTLLPGHLRLLESLQYPLNPSLLENVFLAVNRSVSQNALSQILPQNVVMQLLEVILRYVLLDHGEFVIFLVAQADDRVTNRQQSQTAARPVRKVGRLDDLSIKESEVNAILNKTMAELAALQTGADIEDDVFNVARTLLSMKTVSEHDLSQMVSTILPTPTLLFVTLPATSPLHMFLSSEDIRSYALLNGYLLSIRRAGIHLSALWKLSSHRRTVPSSTAPPSREPRARQASFAARRQRDAWRTKKTRRHWTCASKALFMINELEAYLQGEVIQSSWSHFRKWITGEDRGGLSSARSSRPGTASSSGRTKMTDLSDGMSEGADSSRHSTSDPRAWAEGHQAYLRALKGALFFDNDGFRGTLKELLNQIDHFIALFSRLQAVWEGLDLQEDDGVVDAFSNHAQEEREVFAEMDRTREAIEATLIEIVGKIREVEKDKRGTTAMDAMTEGLNGVDFNGTKFVPWQVKTVDRLVMKLDSLAGGQEDPRDEFGNVDGYDED
jgi:hypothetical protein